MKALWIELKVHQLGMNMMSPSPFLTDVPKKHSKVFLLGPRKSQGPPVQVELQPNAQPRFFKPVPLFCFCRQMRPWMNLLSKVFLSLLDIPSEPHQ